MRLCRQLTGRRLVPLRVTLAHRRRQPPEFATFFGCKLEFGTGIDQIVFAKSIKDIPIVSADPYLNKILLAHCEQTISHRPTRPDAFRSDVENAIALKLPHGQARVHEIARQLGLSARTFARRLASQGLTFSKLVECLRRDLAEQYLAEPDLSISQIAWLLGYRESGAFTHAFGRWTGKSPRSARAGIAG